MDDNLISQDFVDKVTNDPIQDDALVVKPENPEGIEPSLPSVTNWEPHVSGHGQIYYDGQGHFCKKLECEVNRNSKDLKPVFDAIDRKQTI